MSNLSEAEIIKHIKDEIENETDTFHWFDDMPNNSTRKQIEESIKAHQGLLDLYSKEKRKHQMTINNYQCLIADVSTIAEILELEEDAPIDEIIEKINKEKEKNKELQEELQRQINTREIEEKFMEDNFIHKDKIREKLKEIIEIRNKEFDTVGISMRGSAIDVLKELLEE